jgi:ribose 5-phosphate isomerase B
MLELKPIVMKIAIGADHAGFSLKEGLMGVLRQGGHEVLDRGTYNTESCDYPDFAAAVARDVASGRAERGILVCTTGVGMAMAANKVHGVRAALGTCPEEVELARAHNDANVLTLGSRFTKPEDAEVMTHKFLNTEFAGGRHARRVAKMSAIEDGEQGNRA